MDGYPAGSLDHNVPFLVAAGLSSPSATEDSSDNDSTDQGILVESEIPCVEGKDAEVLGSYLASVDGRRPPWNARSKDRPYKYRVKMVGRVGDLFLDAIQLLTFCSHTVSHHDERAFRETLKTLYLRQFCIRRFHPSRRRPPFTQMASSIQLGFTSTKSMCQAFIYASIR